MREQLNLTTILLRVLIYISLSLFALVMIFPFLYMLMTSLKTSNDVYRFPPQLFPLSPETIEVDGSDRSLYTFTVDGQPRILILTDERERFGFFTTAEQIDADSPRDSRVEVAVPIDDAVETGEDLTVTDSSGDEETFAVYDVTDPNGQVRQLALAYLGSQNLFVDPDDPDIRYYAVERTAQKSEFVDFQFENYGNVFQLNLDRALVNTTLVTMAVVIGQMVTSILGGYAFSRVEFAGRNTLFLMYLGSIMIPFVVLIIPTFRLMVILGWQNQLVSLIIPWIFTAYGTFLLRQFFLSVPKEIEEAALMDGASRFRILWQIFVPLSKPAIATLAIFSFLYAWNSFLWPLLIIGEGNEANHVLTLALIRLSNTFADQPNIVLTGAAIAIVPPMIIFVLAQRYFIEGVATSGLKG